MGWALDIEGRMIVAYRRKALYPGNFVRLRVIFGFS
jgi:hypothetical protein